MEKIAVILITFLPTLYEAFTDRFGEQKKDKLTDGIILGVASVIMTAVAYLVLKNWIAVPLFILIWRFAAFDYVCHAFLKKYSDNHPHINIWYYTGKSTHWHDQLADKIHPAIRFAVRLIVFAGSIALFLTSNQNA